MDACNNRLTILYFGQRLSYSEKLEFNIVVRLFAYFSGNDLETGSKICPIFCSISKRVSQVREELS